MFHIDFGFIFGQDPKPMPPPFRFIRAMADAMGGEEGEGYGRFKSYCCQVSAVTLHVPVGLIHPGLYVAPYPVSMHLVRRPV
jgi:hypothetical protein